MSKYSLEILIPIYARDDHHYHLLRQCIDSIERHIPSSHYGRVVIVDDHSPSRKLEEYLDYLERGSRFRILRNGPPRESYYGGGGAAETKSQGHGGSLNKGISAVESEYVMILDPDSLILKPEIIERSMACFGIDPMIMAIGQLTGNFSGAQVVDADMKRRLDRDFKNSYQGIINACLTVIKTEAWTRHGLNKFDNSGWTHGAFCKSVYERNFKMCNFDFYRDFHAAHFGGGILKSIRHSPSDAKYNFGFDPRVGNYERKRSKEYYAGHPDLLIDTPDFIGSLSEIYRNLPFGEAPDLPSVRKSDDGRWVLALDRERER